MPLLVERLSDSQGFPVQKYFIPECVGRGLQLDLRVRAAPDWRIIFWWTGVVKSQKCDPSKLLIHKGGWLHETFAAFDIAFTLLIVVLIASSLP